MSRHSSMVSGPASRLLIAVALVAASCSAPPAPLLVGGVPVEDPALLADSASALLPDLLEGYGAAASPAPECFFSMGEDGEAEPLLFCGPVSVLYGSGPWAKLALDVSSGSPVVSQVTEVGVPGPRGRALLSADGTPAPEDAFIPPPPLAPGRVLLLQELPSPLLRVSRDGWELRSPVSGAEVSTALRVVSTVETASFGSGYAQVSAPPGHRLAVVELETRAGVGGSDVLLLGSRLTGLAPFLVFPVAEGDPLPELTLEGPEATQTLSLEDGTRGGNFRAIWYGSPTFRVMSDGPLVVSVPLPPLTVPGDTVARSFPAEVAASFEVMPPSLSGPYGRVAPAGSVWVPIAVRRPSVSSGSQFVPTSLLYAGSYAAGPVEGLLEVAPSAAGSALYALVPEDLPELSATVDVLVAWETRTFAAVGSGVVPAGSVRVSVVFG